MRKACRILRNIFIGIITLIFFIIIINQGITVYEKHTYKAPGKMVKVDNKNLHVYEKGSGSNTIVLLSGLGTAAPVLDFEPLIDELSKNNKVVVAEGFGYGWSDLTDKERSVENIVEELRTALKEADIPGPYVLMPHSVSGIYAMYYSHKYPEEIKAFVGIDCTLPKVYEYFEEQKELSIPEIVGLCAPTGAARLLTMLNSHNILPEDDNKIYSEENLKETKIISSWKLYNKTVISESKELKKNINKTKEIEFNENLPVLLFTIESSKTRDDGKTNESFCMSYLENVKNHKVDVMDGHHYLHWTQSENMSKETNEFLSKV